MRTSLISICLVISIVRAGAQEPTAVPVERLIDDKQLVERAAVIRPVLEEVLGATFDATPKLVVSTTARIAEVLREEQMIFRSQLPGLDEERLEAEVDLMVDSLSPWLLAKLDSRRGVVLFAPEAFQRVHDVAKGYAGVLDPKFLDVIIAHELVHVFQNQKVGVMKFFGTPDSADALEVRGAVVEGHAQHVARLAAAKMGRSREFDLFVKLNSAVPEEIEDPAEHMLAQARVAQARFSYVEGEKFVAAVVEALGKKKAFERLFTAPPQKPSLISLPGAYLEPVERPYDLEIIGRRLASYLEELDLKTRVISVNKSNLEAGLAPAGNEAVSKGMSGYVDAVAVAGLPAGEGSIPGTQVTLAVMDFDTAASAKGFVELERIVLEKKDELLRGQGAGGLIELESSKYDAKAMGETPSILSVKTLLQRGFEEPYDVTSLAFSVDHFAVEATVVLLPVSKKQLLTMAKKAQALLRDVLSNPSVYRKPPVAPAEKE